MLTAVDFGSLAYGSDELVSINVTIKYDWAFLEIPQRTDAKTWTINPTAVTGLE